MWGGDDEAVLLGFTDNRKYQLCYGICSEAVAFSGFCVLSMYRRNVRVAGDLLPKGRDLAVARFGAPSRAQLYTLGGEPAWLDARLGRPDDLSPTVFALWRLPGLLPRVVTRHSAVSQFLVGAFGSSEAL